MIRTPFYFFLHYKYEIFDQKNFSYIKKGPEGPFRKNKNRNWKIQKTFGSYIPKGILFAYKNHSRVQ